MNYILVKKCPKNEQYLQYGICEGTCDHIFTSCPADFCQPPGCYCITGFVRNHLGTCVKIQECPRE